MATWPLDFAAAWHWHRVVVITRKSSCVFARNSTRLDPRATASCEPVLCPFRTRPLHRRTGRSRAAGVTSHFSTIRLTGRAMAIKPTSLGDLIVNNGTTTYVLGILYLVSLVFAARRFLLLQRRWCCCCSAPSRWRTPQLFLASILVGLTMRTLSFLTLSVLALRDITVPSSSSSSASSSGDMYHRLLAVLFNAGDWACISTYLLLVVVWVEALQRARRHYFSESRIRRDWRVALAVLTAVLYAAQAGLYIAVFVAPADRTQTLLDVIYACVAAFNFAIPAVLLTAYVLYSVIMFAGFPYRSKAATASFMTISKLVGWWTAGRVLWGVAALLVSQESMVTALAAVGDWAFALVTGTMFVLAELLPYLMSLGTGVLQWFSDGPLPGEAGQAAAAAAASGPRAAIDPYAVDVGTGSTGADALLPGINAGVDTAAVLASMGGVAGLDDDDDDDGGTGLGSGIGRASSQHQHRNSALQPPAHAAASGLSSGGDRRSWLPSRSAASAAVTVPILSSEPRTPP